MAKAKTLKVRRGGLEASVPKQSAPKKSQRTAEEQRIERLMDIIPAVCSGQWRDELIGNPATVYPVPGMVLSRCRVLTTGDMMSNNAGEVGTRRWHPALTDQLEDMLDRLEIKKAAKYHHPPAVRYDHCTPYREAVVYDPRTIRVDDTDENIYRCVRLEAWPDGRKVRTSWPVYTRHKTPTGDWLRHKGKVVETDTGRRARGRDWIVPMPRETIVNAYKQVVE